MKKIILGSLLVCSFGLAACGKQTAKTAETSNSIAASTVVSTTSSEQTTETSNKENISLLDNNPYAKNRISDDNRFPEKGDYQIYQGLVTTYLTGLIDIDDYSAAGLDFFNTQYVVLAMGELSEGSLSNFIPSYGGESALFDDPSINADSQKYAVFLSLETDVKNTTDDTLTFDGFAGNYGGEYDWTIPGNKQIDRENIAYDDETASLDVQGKNTVEDKTLNILLATGNTMKEAVEKLPQGTVRIKTAGVVSPDYDDLGGERTLELKTGAQ